MGLEEIFEIGRKPKKKSVTITVDSDLWEKFGRLAKAKNLSKSSIVNALVEGFVKKSESLVK